MPEFGAKRGEFLPLPPNFELYLQECCKFCGANRLWVESDVRGKPQHSCQERGAGDMWVFPDYHGPELLGDLE